MGRVWEGRDMTYENGDEGKRVRDGKWKWRSGKQILEVSLKERKGRKRKKDRKGRREGRTWRRRGLVWFLASAPGSASFAFVCLSVNRINQKVNNF